MGLNRQPKKKVDNSSVGNRRTAAAGNYQQKKNDYARGRGGGGRGRGGGARKEMEISSESREMIMDVLQHIATGGSSEVSASHFDPNNRSNVITFKKNLQLSPSEYVQLCLEKNGFPPDVVTQYLVEIDQTSKMPLGFRNLMELERDQQRFLRAAMWDLFEVMIWNHELTLATNDAAPPGEDEIQDADKGISDEEWELRNEAREQEVELLEMMFGDDEILLDANTFLEGQEEDDDDDDCELFLVELVTKDAVKALLKIKLLPNYPQDPPLVQVASYPIKPKRDQKPEKGKKKSAAEVTTSVQDTLGVPSSTMVPWAPQAIRAVYDAAVDAVAAMNGMPCLTSVIPACRDAAGDQLAKAKPLTTQGETDRQKAEAKEREAKMKASKTKEKRREDFVNALHDEKKAATAGGGEAKSKKNEPEPPVAGADAKDLARALPEAVQYEAFTPDGDGQGGGLGSNSTSTRTKFLRRNPKMDEELQAQWTKLQEVGKLIPRRKELPAAQLKKLITDTMSKTDVIVVSGETGSGKTTQVPQFVLEHEIEENRGSLCNIICTQPRRLAATAVALRVADERDLPVGDQVGYSIRLENKSSKATRLNYCTTGILLRKLQVDPFLGDVSHVIVDEIHERSVDTDFLLILLRDLLVRRPSDFKIVLMSATMNAELFSNYFGGAPHVTIPGRTFPVEKFFLEDVVQMTGYSIDDSSPYAGAIGVGQRQRNNNKMRHLSEIDVAADEFGEELALEKAAKNMLDTTTAGQKKAATAGGGAAGPGQVITKDTLMTLARMNLDTINYELIERLVEYIDTTHEYEGAILIFLPGMAEIQKCMEELQSNRALAARCQFHNLHSSLGSSEQTAVFNRAKKGKRKVVIGTNIMETSITIDDAVFVIDCGKFKENRYDAKRSMSQLITCWIAKSNASQRQGRAGRVREGLCYRLYTEQQFNKLQDHQICEMHRVPLESLVLQITLLNLGDEMAYLAKALSPPEEKAVKAAVAVLRSLGALTEDKRLTSLGYHLASLPLDVRIGKMIIHGALLKCVDPVLTIAACLSVKSPFLNLQEDRDRIEGIRKGFSGDHRSDHLSAWFAYLKWRSIKHRDGERAANDFAWEAFLSVGALTQIQSTKKQYERYLVEAGFLISTEGQRARGTGYTHFAFQAHETISGNCFESGGREHNSNSQLPKLMLSCITAGLYPNVARVVRKPKFNRLVCMDGTDVIVHPSSVNAKHDFPLPFVAYVDKVKTSQTFLRETSMISPYTLLLFGGPITFLDNYSEILIGNFVSLQCAKQDGVLLSRLREQLDSTLRSKINDPTVQWETTATHVVSAIVKLLGEEGMSTAMSVIDRSPRQGLTKNFIQPGNNNGGGGGGGGKDHPAPTGGAAAVAGGGGGGGPKKPRWVNRECFNCGEMGHLGRDCPAEKRLPASQGGPTVRCFVCGLKTHHPPLCPLVKKSK